MIKTIRYWIIKTVGISKGEANALLILGPILFLAIVLPPLFNHAFKERYASHTTDQAILDSMLAQIQQNNLQDSISSIERKLSVERFDPNSAPLHLLESNGIPNSIGQRIINYRQKGGEFKKKEDLLKIYGMRDELYNSLVSYIYLPTSSKPRTKDKSKVDTYKKSSISAFDLNTADTAILKQVYGIGNKLSIRIIELRDQLGGFIHTEQLEEVYGLRAVAIDSLLSYASIEDAFIPVQVNINSDTIRALSKHPYIEYRIAKAIISYRRQHGNYTKLEQLKNLHLMSDSIFQSLSPYLKVID